MKKIEFYDVGNPIIQKDIDDFEAKFNIRLPQNYKKLLLRFNGGIPSEDCIYIDINNVPIVRKEIDINTILNSQVK